MSRAPLLLTDEQMRKFIAEGYLLLQADFSPDFHQRLTAELNHVYEKEGNPGNNLLPRIRELQQVFEHPVITGALTSVLGPDYMLHAHRHGHYNASSKPGGWHKDSYWGYSKMRNHHPWWAMIMYFPQDTPVELGPTGLLPGTQNYESRVFPSDEMKEEALASGQAGTFLLIHYDIWHRSTPNTLGLPRYMLKFEFMRTKAPDQPNWDNRESAWQAPADASLPIARHDAMWEDTWNWLSGRNCSLANTADGAIVSLESELVDDYEPTAINAAYGLARHGKLGVEALLRGLHHERKAVSRTAAYGLSVAGTDAVTGLAEALASEREYVVIHAAFALGELRGLAASAVPKLCELVQHASETVRHTAVEALGMIGADAVDGGGAGAAGTAGASGDVAGAVGTNGGGAGGVKTADANGGQAGSAAAIDAATLRQLVDGLVAGLCDESVQVRFTAGLALCRVGAKAEAAIAQLELALDDDNRYVRAHATEALRYIGTDRAKNVLIDALLKARWCTSTTPASTFYP